MATPSLLDALSTCGLTGPTWQPWRTIARVLAGQPLGRDEQALFEQCTRRARVPTEPPAEFYAIIGRRGGKSRFAGATSAWAAGRRYPLAPGERAVVGLAAADRDQARILYTYASAPFTSSVTRGVQALKALVQRETRWSLDLQTGVSIEVRTSHFGRIRGRIYALAIADELAFWQSDDGSNPASEVLAAIRPGLATLGGQLIGISSPFAKAGPLWDLYTRYFGRDDPRVIVWQAATRTMNPSIAQSVVDDALARDEDSARAEWLAEFREDSAALVTDAALRAVTRADDTPTRPPHDGEPVIFVDPASGSGSDAMTTGIAVRTAGPDGRPVAHVVGVAEAKPPFDPTLVVADLAEVCRDLGVTRVVGDRFAQGWCSALFRGVGLTYVPSPLTKSELYVQMLVLINTRSVSLPNDASLLTQLTGLQRRATAGGRDSVDHRVGAHDDLANAAAGAAVLTLRARPALRVL